MAKALTCLEAGIPDCPFSITAPTEDEVLRHADMHISEVHGMHLTAEKLEETRTVIRDV